MIILTKRQLNIGATLLVELTFEAWKQTLEH